MSCVTARDDSVATVVVVEPQNDVVELDNDSVVVTTDESITILELDPQIVLIVEEDPLIIEAACEQGPPGTPGLDGTGVVALTPVVVAPAATEPVDFLAINTYRSVKWIVTITDSVGSFYKSYEVLAVHNGTTALYTVYGKIGDPIDVTTEVAINGASLELQITNNSSNSITVDGQRLATLI